MRCFDSIKNELYSLTENNSYILCRLVVYLCFNTLLLSIVNVIILLILLIGYV